MAKVTILMPTYNVAPYVREAIDSVLRQTYRDFELLVVDDCSTDDTVSTVQSIDDPRIRIIQNERNIGLAANLNRGLSLVNTELVARMDGDDIAEPFWLEHEVAFLDSHPEVGICGGGFERFGTTEARVSFPERHEDIVANMLFECSVIVPTFRMSLWRDHGLRYRTEAFPAEDYRFWAECLRITKIYNLSETLFRYRMHPSQICTARREEQRGKVDDVRLFMLDWLSTDFSEEEKRYHTELFMAPQIKDSHDFAERKAFASTLVERNRSLKHFDEQALRRRLDKYLTISLQDTIVDRFFAQGYSLRRYLRYLASGLALKTGFHYESRFLMKSLLHRKQ